MRYESTDIRSEFLIAQYDSSTAAYRSKLVTLRIPNIFRIVDIGHRQIYDFHQDRQTFCFLVLSPHFQYIFKERFAKKEAFFYKV